MLGLKGNQSATALDARHSAVAALSVGIYRSGEKKWSSSRQIDGLERDGARDECGKRGLDALIIS